jgi:hypothetical protein
MVGEASVEHGIHAMSMKTMVDEVRDLSAPIASQEISCL